MLRCKVRNATKRRRDERSDGFGLGTRARRAGHSSTHTPSRWVTRTAPHRTYEIIHQSSYYISYRIVKYPDPSRHAAQPQQHHAGSSSTFHPTGRGKARPTGRRSQPGASCNKGVGDVGTGPNYKNRTAQHSTSSETPRVANTTQRNLFVIGLALSIVMLVLRLPSRSHIC